MSSTRIVPRDRSRPCARSPGPDRSRASSWRSRARTSCRDRGRNARTGIGHLDAQPTRCRRRRVASDAKSSPTPSIGADGVVDQVDQRPPHLLGVDREPARPGDRGRLATRCPAARGTARAPIRRPRRTPPAWARPAASGRTRENSSTSCLRPVQTSCSIEAVASSSTWSRSSDLAKNFLRSRWAASWIGVSGFLISWAIRRATSCQARPSAPAAGRTGPRS